MSRHAFDDFSFLPTVDSTDEEIVEKSHDAQQPLQPENTEPMHEEVTEHVGAEEPVHEPVYEEVYEEVAESPEPLVFEQEATSEAPVSEFEAHAEETSPEAEGFIGDRHKELEPASAAAAPPQPAMQLPKREEDVSPAPKVERQSGAPEEKPFKAESSSDDVSADLAKGDAEAKTAKDPKPFIAPKPPPEEPLDPEQAKKLRWQQLADKIGLRTLGMSFGVHLFLLLIAAFVGVSQVMDRQVDFLPGGSSAQSQAAAAELTHKIQNKKNPWLKAKPVQRKITVQTLSTNIVMPEMAPMEMMDFSQINNRMDLSKAPSMGASQPMGMGGAGGGFGAGIGRGGKFSFVGQTAVGSRVVFVIDVSASMNNLIEGQTITRFQLLQKELNKTVGQIPFGTAFQILYFSDFAWPHNEVDGRDATARSNYQWIITPETFKNVKIPSFKYIQATPFSLQDSKKIIDESVETGGTNWGAGLLMALNAKPKPDIIFFMTDGYHSDENGWIDIVTDENKRSLPRTVIHTSVMAIEDASKDMARLAKNNNGTFSIVKGDGKVVKVK